MFYVLEMHAEAAMLLPSFPFLCCPFVLPRRGRCFTTVGLGFRYKYDYARRGRSALRGRARRGRAARPAALGGALRA